MLRRYNLSDPMKDGTEHDEKPRRRSLRLRDYDYTACGAYFVTICAADRRCIFGSITNGTVHLSQLGGIADDCWLAIPQHFPNVELDEHVVMPNHMHGILALVAAQHAAPVTKPSPRFAVKPGSLGAIVRSFKSAVTKRTNELQIAPEAGAGTEISTSTLSAMRKSLQRIREYIATNPLRWDLDAENSQRKGEDEFDRWLRRFGPSVTARR